MNTEDKIVPAALLPDQPEQIPPVELLRNILQAKPLDHQFAKVLNDNLWELYADDGLVLPPVAAPVSQREGALSGWTSVEDSVPGLDVPVWLYEAERGVWVGGRSDGGDGWLWRNCCGTQFMRNGAWEAQEFDMDDDYMPTHWMPLPTAPEASPASHTGSIASKETVETAAPGASTEDAQ